MPGNLALFILLVFAIGIGYVLGRWGVRTVNSPASGSTLKQDYFKGLNYVLNEQHDLAIDTFIDAMAVTDETVATHLALGSLVRRQGEVEKAITIHQNVLAEPVLSGANRTRTELELARDYLLAGLLDRAEHLLLILSGKKGETRQIALEHLMEIYQREREWQKALDTGQKLQSRQNPEIKNVLVHFLCELAENSIHNGDIALARKQLHRAENYDSDCPRVQLIWAEVEFESQHYRDTLRHLARVAALDSGLISETLPLYRRASLELGQSDGYRQYLERAAGRAAGVEVSAELFQLLAREQGDASAGTFLQHQIQLHPSLEFLDLYLHALLQRDQNELLKADLVSARQLLQQYLSQQASYRCENCGFTSSSLLWQCPSCRKWGKNHRRESAEITTEH